MESRRQGRRASRGARRCARPLRDRSPRPVCIGVPAPIAFPPVIRVASPTLLLPVLLACQPASSIAAQDFALQAFVRAHCVDCHGAKEPEAGLDLEALVARAPATADAASWLELRDVLVAREMPPFDEPQPSDAERSDAVAIVQKLVAALNADGVADPGRVTMRRLSRFEYAHTVRDLVGVEVDLAEFPADDLAFGFDNHGGALTLSPLHLEKYAAVAQQIAAQALPDLDPKTPPVLRFDAEQLDCSLDGGASSDAVALISHGSAHRRVELPRAGRYRVRVTAWSTPAGDEVARLELRVDDRVIARHDVPQTRAEPGVFTDELELPRNATIAAWFVNDHWEPKHKDPARRDRNLYVQAIEIEGPLDPRGQTSAESWLADLEPARGTARARARPVVTELLRRAWRRPPKTRELDRFTALVTTVVDDGESFRAGLRLALAAALVSPSFLFRVEAEPRRVTAATPLDDYAIASRLSYFLWSSMPDDALFARARAGELREVGAVVAEARRMLADPRADAIATSFAAQWLELRKLDALAPDPERFPEWSAELGRALRTETELLVLAVLRENRALGQLLLTDESFLDPFLARHYGLPPLDGAGFRRVALEGRRLGGLLGHGSVLAISSHPTRSSPVRRGKWVLDQLLDDPPPAPAPGTDSFPPDVRIETPADLRAQLARHREDQSCAVCHDRIDPLGLALEGFDPLGRVRSGETVDTSGRLPDGRLLKGPDDLRRVIAASPGFARGVARKLFSYAIGRDVRPVDLLALDRALAELGTDPPLAELVLAIVRLDAFRARSGHSTEKDSR